MTIIVKRGANNSSIKTDQFIYISIRISYISINSSTYNCANGRWPIKSPIKH